NALLCSLLVWATFVTLCNAQCYVILNENTPDNLSNECKDLDGVTHPMNSTWKTESCVECSCGQDGINCCNTLCFCLNDSVAVPVGYDKIKCQKIFNKETCSYKVVERENAEKICSVSGWML
ncbi:hypothetical protein HPG69_015430, partial [Diceros bicornis minor]